MSEHKLITPTPDWRCFLEDHHIVRRIAVTEVGSTAHGASDGSDDFDVSIVWVERMRDIFAFKPPKPRRMIRTQPEGVPSGPGDIDANVYTLRAWANLAIKGNPSVLQMLWAPELETTWAWQSIQDVSHFFIARHIIDPYQGYMKSQVERLLGVRGGSHGPGSGQRADLVERHGYDTKYAMHAARLGHQCIELLTTGRLNMPMIGEPGDWLRAVRVGEVPFEEWWERVQSLDSRLTALRDDTKWPELPNWQGVEQIVRDIHITVNHLVRRQ